MSKTINQEGWIVWRKYDWEDKPNFVFTDYKPTQSADSVPVMPYTLSFELPDGFDPIPGQVAAIEQEKLRALAEYQSTVAKLNDQLAKLQAITHEPEEA